MHKQEKNNASFAKLVKRFHLVKTSDNVLETVCSTELESVSSHLNCDATIIQSGYGTIKCSSSIPETIGPICYVSNGIYHDTEKIILGLLGSGSFAVGVCDNPNSVFYGQNIKRLEDLEKMLRKNHVRCKKYTHYNHRDSAVILYYRR